MGLTHTQDWRCNECRCYYLEPYIIADCVNKGLYDLPTFNEKDALIVRYMYIMNNYIVKLDESVLSTWVQLEFLNISYNAIQCIELEKIPDRIQVESTCIDEYGE